MKTLITLYYIFMMVASIGIILAFGFHAIRAMINRSDAIIVFLLWTIVYVVYKMMLIPSIQDYKEYKKRYRNE